MNPAVTVKNDILVVSLDEMKKQLRYEHTDDEDFHISSLTQAAQEQAEAIMNRRLLATTMELKLKKWTDWIILPYGSPLQEVSSVKYYDSANSLQTLSASAYSVYSHHEPARIEIDGMPTVYDRDDAIVITYKAGWDDVSEVPESVKLWIKIKVSDMFTIRQSSIIGASVSAVYDPDILLMPHRIILL